MLPGQQAAIIAHQASQAAHHAAIHAAAQTSFYNYRNAALLDLADRIIGQMSDALAQFLGLTTTVRQVLISADSQRHAIARRAIASKVDSELVATRIVEAFENLAYWLLPQREP